MSDYGYKVEENEDGSFAVVDTTTGFDVQACSSLDLRTADEVMVKLNRLVAEDAAKATPVTDTDQVNQLVPLLPRWGYAHLDVYVVQDVVRRLYGRVDVASLSPAQLVRAFQWAESES